MLAQTTIDEVRDHTINRPLTYTDLEDFFGQCRKEVTAPRLKAIQQYAATVPLPAVLGIFLDKAHYLETLEIALASTEETRRRIYFICKEVVSRLKEKKEMLDVGPGNGKLTITLVDNNEEILNDTSIFRGIFSKKRHLKKKLGSIDNMELPKHRYDLALLAHILYYVPQEHWANIVEETFDSLKKGGALVMVLSGDSLGKADLIRYFGGKTLKIDECVQNLQDALSAAEFKLFASKEEFITNDLNTALHIAGFFLADAKTEAPQEEVAAYLEKHCRFQDKFCITSLQKFILVQKINF